MKRSPAVPCALVLLFHFAFGCGASGSGDPMDFTTIDDGNEAIGAIVQHASAQDEAYATLLEVFSQRFTLPLFDPAVELDGEAYDDIVAVQEAIVDSHDAYLRALEYIADSQDTSVAGALALETGGVRIVKIGLIKSMKGFFWDWAYGNQKRSRDRILAASDGTSAQTRQEMYDTAHAKFGDKVGASADDMFTKLRNGELDRQAPQLHSNFATAVLDYGLECVDKKLTPTRVAAEEGAEGVKRGVDVVVDSSVAIINSKFSGFAKGFKTGQNAVKKINKIHDKPVEAIQDEIKIKARQWIVAKIGDKLGSTAGTMADAIAKAAGQYLAQKDRVEQPSAPVPAGSCRVKGAFGASGSATKPADVKGIVMTGDGGNAEAKDVVVNLGDPSEGKDPVVVPCGNYAVDVVGEGTTQTQDVTVSEGIDAVIPIDLGDGVPLSNDKVWTDPATGLVWQRVVSSRTAGLTWDEAFAWCRNNTDGLPGSDWRVPTISELRSTVRGCDGSVTGGTCGVTDSCLDNDACWSDSGCYNCAAGAGPADGCYWDSNLQGDCTSLWSSSNLAGSSSVWYVQFLYGFIGSHQPDLVTIGTEVRCVRSAP